MMDLRDDGNPFRSPSPGAELPVPPAAAPAASRFGDHLNRAFTAYFNQWQQWIGPMLVAALITISTYCLCCFPSFLVQGPLSCGLYCCALRGLRGQAVDVSGLNRAWDVLGTAIFAGFSLMLLQALPGLLFAVVLFCGMNLAIAGGGAVDPEGSAMGAIAAVLLMAGYLAAIAVTTALNFWIGTRTLFVMPLIADRGYGFMPALEASWETTRHRFWELLLLYFLASLIGMIGMYFCYIGVVFTLPLYFLIISAAYEERFPLDPRLSLG